MKIVGYLMGAVAGALSTLWFGWWGNGLVMIGSLGAMFVIAAKMRERS